MAVVSCNAQVPFALSYKNVMHACSWHDEGNGLSEDDVC
jgi:hypothetical protein